MAKCCSSNSDKDEILQDIRKIEYKDIEKNDAICIETVVRKFLMTEEYDEKETKMVFRGYIMTKTP